MRRRSLARAALLLVFSAGAWGSAPPQPAKPSSPQPPSQQPDSSPANGELEKVLSRMDATAATFRSAEANFDWVEHNSIVDQNDEESGKIYFRRQGTGVEMAADITSSDGKPMAKYVLYTDGKVQVYQPAIKDQVDDYNTGNNREAVESFLVLGFGGSGHALFKSFDVTYLGPDQKVAGAVGLSLVPKAEKVRDMFDHIVLWIDPARGVSVQQQLFQKDGDYRLAKYSDIRLNTKIADSVFKLKTKTNGRTQVISH
jgi:outer membrane lipoprotein-sorting protein